MFLIFINYYGINTLITYDFPGSPNSAHDLCIGSYRLISEESETIVQETTVSIVPRIV